MGKIYSLIDRTRSRCDAELRTYIAAATQIPVFGDNGIDVQTDWKVFLGDPSRPRHTITFHFSRLQSDLAEFCRAFILRTCCARNHKPHGSSTVFQTFTFLSQAMEEAGCCCVIDLTPAIFSRAQRIIEERQYAAVTIAAHCNYLKRISTELSTFQICLLEFNWTHPHRKKQVQDVFSQEARSKQKNLLPSKISLQALADIRPIIEREMKLGSDKARFDLIIYWLVVVLFSTGLRANEVISLQEDFLIKKSIIDENGNEKSVYFLRRRTSKGGPSDAKPLSPVAALLCRKAQKYLRLLTRPARQALGSYLEIGDTAPDWKIQKNIRLNGTTIRKYLKIDSERAIALLFKKLGREDVIYLHDLREYLNFRQESILQGYRREDLKDRYFPVMTFWPGKTAPKLGGRAVRFIDYPDLRNFLAGNSREVKSAFVRYLNAEHYLATHQFRRLMDTAVREGGISENELAILQGRSSPAQNAVYDYRTPDERARDVKDAIRSGGAFGWTANAYRALPKNEREEFLDSVVQVAYQTSVGHCLTNISEDPCPYHLQCLSGCGDYLHVKGDKTAVTALVAHKKWASSLLEILAKTETSEPDLRVGAQNHRSHLNRQIKTVDRVLALEANPVIRLGKTVQVYPDLDTLATDPDKW